MPRRDVRDVDFRTAHRHFILWARGGIFEKTYRRLLALCNRRKRDGTFLAIDTTFVKNVFGTDVLGRNPTDRGRKASKVVAVVDERGLPHRLGFLPANVTEDERRPRWSLSLTTKGCRIGWGFSPPTFLTTVCCTNASRNIGLQLKRLLQDKGPIRQLSDRDLEFNRHQLCLGCEE